MTTGWFIITFIFIVLVLLPLALAGISAAPWVPTKKKDIKRAVELANIQKGEIVYDLGCGDGRFLVSAYQSVPAGKYIGIDLSWLQVLHAKLNVLSKGFRKNIRIKLGSLFAEDLTKANLIFLFLLPKVFPKIAFKLRQELAPGTRVISAVWPISDLADKLVKVSQPDKKSDLPFYLYQM